MNDAATARKILEENGEPVGAIRCDHWTPAQWIEWNRICAKFEKPRPPLDAPKPLKKAEAGQ